MGLTIHYDLRFKGTQNEARDKLRELRNKAMDMAFEEVSDVANFVGPEANYMNHRNNGPNHNGDDEWVWPLIHAMGGGVVVGPDGRKLKRGEQSYVGCCHISIPPEEVIMFDTWPGEGCESATFGLARYPDTIDYHYRPIKTGLGNGWHWGSFCKTQYANEHGILHFIKCHTLVIAMLDHAKELDILKSVHDEGHYWTKRNLKALVLEIGEWDRFIAGFAGKFKESFCDNLQSAIESHPSYERLRDAGLKHLNKTALEQLISLTPNTI